MYFLFYVYVENGNVRPRVTNDVCLNNHKVIVIPHSVPESVNDGSINVLNASDGTVVIEVDKNIEPSELEALVRNNSANEHSNNSLDSGFITDNAIDNSILFDNPEMVVPEDWPDDVHQKGLH